jgi:transposase
MANDKGTGTRLAKPFSPEVRERAVRLVQEQQGAHETPWAAIRSIADKIGGSPETFRLWVRL